SSRLAVFELQPASGVLEGRRLLSHEFLPVCGDVQWAIHPRFWVQAPPEQFSDKIYWTQDDCDQWEFGKGFRKPRLFWLQFPTCGRVNVPGRDMLLVEVGLNDVRKLRRQFLVLGGVRFRNVALILANLRTPDFFFDYSDVD